LDGDQEQAPNGVEGCVENKNKDCSSSSCHTVYGTVTDGLEYIDAISKINTGQNDKPSYDVTIVSIEITDDGVVDGEAWYKFW
ncbi:MAG: hypothetical protein HN544_06670, partial [Euryarchaeota archaeon]|nr:hypothetical protein [Euryarchaeota archaeon]